MFVYDSQNPTINDEALIEAFESMINEPPYEDSSFDYQTVAFEQQEYDGYINISEPTWY